MKKNLYSLFVLAFCLSISTNCLAQERELNKLQTRPQFKTLPKQEKAVWEDYIKRSEHLAAIDKKLISAELKKIGSNKPSIPPDAREYGFDYEQPTEWYATDAGRRVADIVLSFQTPSGGWSKRTDMSQRPRKIGEAFGVEEQYIPTFDNRATTTQIRVLAKAFQATNKKDYANAVLKGLQLIFQAQYPNGCWPQNYPLVGGYHDLVTYNDNAMTHILLLLQDVVSGEKPFQFIPNDVIEAAAVSIRRGVECILKTQIEVKGEKLIWGAQHNMFSFESEPARKFEPASLSSQESNFILLFLMSLPNPDDAVIASIESAIAWFKKNQIDGYVWIRTGKNAGLKKDLAAPPLWSRFCEIGTDKPIFGDRDGVVYYDVNKISEERRRGYGWYTALPEEAMNRYAEWRKAMAPFYVKQNLYDHTKPETLGLSFAKNAETITIFRPEEDSDKYNHNVVLFPFKGFLYAQWQSSSRDEDAADTWVAYSRSRDGKNWSKPVMLASSWQGGIRTAGGWWSDDKTLVSYINVWPQQTPGDLSGGGYVEYLTSVDGIDWSEPKALLNHAGKPVKGIFEQDPHALPDGRIINAVHEQPGLVVSPYYTDDTKGISGWTKGRMSNLPFSGTVSRELEPSWFYQADGAVVMVFRDQASSFRKLASVSTDRGETWSKPVLTNMPDSRSKQSAGNLPNGSAFQVANPRDNKARFPLVITLSKDGELFDKAYLLRSGGSDLQPLRFEGRYKRAGYSYPKSVIWNDYLYVSYATNKEDIELTRIPLKYLSY
ncbi:MAG: pectate lyase [Gammaproteobacteria bacterium]|nr:pectate lyase [Gammaproteobacteria bacterium]